MDQKQSFATEDIDRLDEHALLLAGHRLESATRLREGADAELAPLMQLAERVGQALQPLAPEPTFRRSLREALQEEASRASSRPRVRLPVAGRLLGGGRLSSRRARSLIGGGAAVAAVVGVAAYYWLGRGETERVAAG